MADELEDWKTDDITLAAWLMMHFDLNGTKWIGRKCYWMFDDTDELADRVSDYVGGFAEGNLKEYNSIIAALKRDMYDAEGNRGFPRPRHVTS